MISGAVGKDEGGRTASDQGFRTDRLEFVGPPRRGMEAVLSWVPKKRSPGLGFGGECSVQALSVGGR